LPEKVAKKSFFAIDSLYPLFILSCHAYVLNRSHADRYKELPAADVSFGIHPDNFQPLRESLADE
jgi:hypothetical protein